jgi:hypothetical protein
LRDESPYWRRGFLRELLLCAISPALRLLLEKEFEAVTGALFLKIKKFKQIAPSARTLESKTGARLWELSELLTVTI